MKYLIFIFIIFNTAVFSQPMIFELKDTPSSITYHYDGSADTFTTTFTYDSKRRIIKIENGLVYKNLTAIYNKIGDTTIITAFFEAKPEIGLEPDTQITKQICNSSGKPIYEGYYDNQQIQSECWFFYNQENDLIKEVYKDCLTDKPHSDTMNYEWEISKHLISVTGNEDDSVHIYSRYEIDDNKRITRTINLQSDSTPSRNWTHAILNYNSTSIANLSGTKSAAVHIKSNGEKVFMVNGREMTGHSHSATSVFIRKNKNRISGRLYLK